MLLLGAERELILALGIVAGVFMVSSRVQIRSATF
jgi:type IV secretory pathway TrbD component